MKLCAVKWCAAEATRGEYCPVHAKNTKLHPDYLAADEVFAPDLAECKDCDGSGDCEKCDGEGECDHGGDCYHCGAERAGHECGACEGSGKCQTCHGEGRVCYTKKKVEAVA